MSRAFTHDEQLAFARLSGDFNPIHLDPILARRLMFGRTILHGLHLVLWAVDLWLGERTSPVRLKSIRVDFRRPASAGQLLECNYLVNVGGHAKIELTTDGLSVLTVELHMAQGNAEGIKIPEFIPHPMEAKEAPVEDLRQCSGRLPLWLDREAASKLFPNVTRLLPAEQIAALLATTRLVGMHAPGLHSVWRGFQLSDHSRDGVPELLYHAVKFDERFSLLDLQVEAPGLSGTLATGVRPPPMVQTSYVAMRPGVAPDAFHGERALVIGGSRGLGEVAVKLLAAGGADVRFTYHTGEDDANRAVREITEGGGSALCFGYDILGDPTALADGLGAWRPTLLCYFATPFIFAGTQGRFSAELFRTFCDFYVTGFHQTFVAMNEVSRVLYPSTVAIEAPPPNLVEYAAAKAAGESLCRSLALAHPDKRIVCPRFPRLATDQTATLLRVPAADPIEAVLSALRSLYK
ncbi:MAG TPA: MaoC/PaaZ C-terminal domain-containing protein [Tepidisphaeraceae bacterium]|nr:MaoC/PaaZ C-terminal domain-containing protein [Tepidisphaeraceae bacterium]